jgi:hypothetical protein
MRAEHEHECHVRVSLVRRCATVHPRTDGSDLRDSGSAGQTGLGYPDSVTRVEHISVPFTAAAHPTIFSVCGLHRTSPRDAPDSPVYAPLHIA